MKDINHSLSPHVFVSLSCSVPLFLLLTHVALACMERPDLWKV